jgi:hypothetical protein
VACELLIFLAMHCNADPVDFLVIQPEKSFLRPKMVARHDLSVCLLMCCLLLGTVFLCIPSIFGPDFVAQLLSSVFGVVL